MQRIITHIERLLLVHDCVIVPNFGGFVLQSVPAVCELQEHTFRPSRKEVVFNSTLQHNDGLLSESYMQMYSVNYRKAQLMLEEDVECIKSGLLQHKKLSLGQFGSFIIGHEGQVIFYPGDSVLFGIGSYGLPVFHFPALKSVRVEREEVRLLTTVQKEKKDTLYIPVSRKLLRTAVASVAAVALFLLISTPVKDVNQEAYTASFVPTEIVSYKSVPVSLDRVIPTSKTTNIETVMKEATEEMTTPVAVTSDSETKKVELEVSKTIVSEVVSQKRNKKFYHIVIASFPTEAQADEYMSGVDRTVCKRVSKVARDGKYRIFADKFDSREQAETYMTSLRANTRYKDAWLFISR